MGNTPADIISMVRIASKRMERERQSADRRTARVCMVIASAFFRKDGGFKEDDFMPGMKKAKPRKVMSGEEFWEFAGAHNERIRHG